MNNRSNIGPHIERPNEQEIAEAIKQVQEKHDVTLSATDAERYVMLRAELGWWIRVCDDGDSSVTDEMAKELQAQASERSGEIITLDEAHIRAKALLLASSESEKARIAGEIKGLINDAK